MLLTKLIREDKPKLDKKMASVSNWATAAYGLANHCEDVVLWLRKHHAWSPRLEIAARVEDRALQKEPYPALPCPTLPCPALPCPTLPYPTLPYPALPYPAEGGAAQCRAG